MSLKRALLWCGVIGPIFFTVANLVKGATRAGYDPMRDVYSILTAGAFFVLFVLFVLAGTGFTGDQTFAPIGGLMQPLSLTVGFAWVVAIALLECRRTFRP